MFLMGAINPLINFTRLQKEARARSNRTHVRAGKKRDINYIIGKGENSKVMEDKKTTRSGFT